MPRSNDRPAMMKRIPLTKRVEIKTDPTRSKVNLRKNFASPPPITRTPAAARMVSMSRVSGTGRTTTRLPAMTVGGGKVSSGSGPSAGSGSMS
jgi:hypothetical protein